jgi:predicted metal-dependent hydrolase
MNQAWVTALAATEVAAQHKQNAEDIAYERFCTARRKIEAAGRSAQVVDTPEFHCWMNARKESDEAWGAWAMIMDAKPVS